ncbi:unnamed protein product [Rotaria sordida]|uniref:Uncharacterized protein n=1 Tax=Rotaria sordida TaxID=392033 RepID=A0A813SA12_9BILA|nr:unnamed protein product [Rotaria sordida]CAF0793676.1 unnamed protein product [Rotaria sordida]CAF0832930.1 unnamed protein product [Rotaria sordida]CAF0896605.1 unnamed protein product [Rotaria sordida]CAF4100641.1 unnamed protein product [Rotaria sordida]
MLNIANVVRSFNQLVEEKYPDCKEDGPSPRDDVTADQLFLVLQLLTTSCDMIEGDITLNIDDYDDDKSYTSESDINEETHTASSHSDSYQTIRDIVEFADTR